jgi:hypothetical protein
MKTAETGAVDDEAGDDDDDDSDDDVGGVVSRGSYHPINDPPVKFGKGKDVPYALLAHLFTVICAHLSIRAYLSICIDTRLS